MKKIIPLLFTIFTFFIMNINVKADGDNNLTCTHKGIDIDKQDNTSKNEKNISNDYYKLQDLKFGTVDEETSIDSLYYGESLKKINGIDSDNPLCVDVTDK